MFCKVNFRQRVNYSCEIVVFTKRFSKDFTDLDVSNLNFLSLLIMSLYNMDVKCTFHGISVCIIVLIYNIFIAVIQFSECFQ